jgi:membrane protease YdiL (CAAX protease family)
MPGGFPMTIKSSDLFSRVTPSSTIGRIVQFPLIRILIAIVFLLPVILIHQLTSGWAKSLPAPYNPWLSYIESIGLLVLMILCYRLYVRLIEKRPMLELSRAGMFAEFGLGLIIGGALMTSTILVLVITGCYRFGSFNSLMPLLTGVIFLGAAALVEELIARVILFKLIEEYFGSWVSIAVMAVLFGLTHLGNPNATFTAALAIMLETGLLLGAAFMLTRRIWLIWGIHIAWNYFQSTIFGVNVSGITLDSLITPQINGPAWLTGGQFGVEASLPAVIICLIAGGIMLQLAIVRGQLVRPAWARKKAVVGVPAD